MRIIADFHTHSRFARACSQNITLKGMESAATEKGIGIVGTGDFLHGSWLSEIKSNLENDNDTSLFKLKGSGSGIRFILSTEISTVFTAKDNSVKKIHHCVVLPSIESVMSLKDALSKYGALESDGRPTLSMSAAELVEKVFSVDANAFVFPAHAWTPYFGVLGSLSGFDSLKEAYQDQEKHIFALETGLSSDEPMNWMVSALDKYTLISNSDMHSLPKLGREANIFETDGGTLDYKGLMKAIRERNDNFKGTIEFYPEEGKYHYDGHRICKFSADPSSGVTKCPVCGKNLVIGVLHRVIDLADRPLGFRPANASPFVHLVPLIEVIAYVMRKSTYSASVNEQYRKLTEHFDTEFKVLMDADVGEIAAQSSPEIAQAVKNVRDGKINIVPGYAGVFGELDLLGRKKGKIEKKVGSQKSLVG